MMTYDVQFYKTRRQPGRGPKPYQARWRVGEKVHPKSFAEEELASNWLVDLRSAARRGESFEVESGLPESKLRELRDVTWYAHAREYAHYRWPDQAGNTRRSMLESLAAVTPALVRDLPGRPDEDLLRQALMKWAFPLVPVDNGTAKAIRWEPPDPPAEARAALQWLEKASLPMSEIAEVRNLSRAIKACARNLDGLPSAPDYFHRRRRGFNTALQYAVALDRLAANPLSGKEIPEDWKPPKLDDEIDPRSIGNPAKVRDLLAVVSYVGRRQGSRFTAWFGCMYYAMMRPEEIAGLEAGGCDLPEEGWGKLTFAGTDPSVGKQFTDDGATHQRRGLKGRGRKASRTVPIPPQLVAMLREHIARFGVGVGGRVFRSERGNRINKSTSWQVWNRTRELGLTAEEFKGPLLKRPYDLRHAGITYRLNTGVPATQVAKWAGNSVEVLQRVYAQVWQDMDQVWIDRMGDHQ